MKWGWFLFIVWCVPFSFRAQTEQGNPAISARDSIHDDAIVVPESLESDIDSLLTDWLMQSRSYIDPSCSSRTENVNFPDSVYIDRLSRLPNQIEMPFNQIVLSYINIYTQRRRALVEYMLGLGAFYFPIFEEELDREGLPLELKYLPVIESALKPGARSRAGAVGLWQFMPGTAKVMGLEINSLIDERCDPIKSTQAAVRYLKELYGIYQDWNLAIAAYNCGPGNINKAIKRADGKKDYWEIYYFLPRETRGYVPAFIAANYVMNYYEEHHICPVLTDMPMSSDTVRVSEQIHFLQLAEVLNLPIDLIRQLNPQYRRDVIPGHIRPHSLRLPMQQLYSFIERKDTVLAYQSGRLSRRAVVQPVELTGNYGSATYHKVRSGESLSVIARKYRVSVNDLKAWNNLRGNNIRAGQRLAVYGKAGGKNKTKSTAAVTPKISGGTEYSYYTVKKGENLWSISRQFPGVSSELIQQVNQMQNNALKVGQVLKIPKV